MKTMNRKFKLLSVLLILVVPAVFLTACGSGSSSDISKPALVSKVTQYDRDYSSDAVDWTEARSYEYEYKDAYPVSQKTTEFDSVVTDDFEYEFKDGKPVKMTHSLPDDRKIEVSYTKKGLVNRAKSYDTTGRKFGEQVFQYGNRDEYFTLVLHENIISPPEEKVIDHMEEVDSVKVTTENGLLRKTVNDGLFANYNDEEEKVWTRFDGTYTAYYADNGILDHTVSLFRTFPGSGNHYKFDLTIEDGRVTEAARSLWAPAETADDEANEESKSADESEGSWDPEVRFVFEYTDTEIDQARYALMINYFLLEGGGNYYIFNWY